MSRLLEVITHEMLHDTVVEYYPAAASLRRDSGPASPFMALCSSRTVVGILK